MDKESIFELQKIDCNCSDCIFMIRDAEKFKTSLETHYKWQLDAFNDAKQKRIEKANEVKDTKYDLATWNLLLNESEKMKFQFDKKECVINYGNCSKFNKEVSFMPNTCQIETQNCFTHRKSA